jgi:hypothetical protein
MRVAGRSAVVMAWVAAGLLLVTGCAGISTGGRLTELHLFGVPVALNLGSKSGPDGIGLRLYASTADVAKGIPIREGVLEVLMFDGSVGEAYARSEKPLKTWSFTSSQLGALAPRQPVVTVIARHVAPNKAVTWSTATTISVVTR